MYISFQQTVALAICLTNTLLSAFPVVFKMFLQYSILVHKCDKTDKCTFLWLVDIIFFVYINRKNILDTVSVLFCLLAAYTTRRNGTVHTSAKGQWRNDVIVAMAMPTTACRALQRHAISPGCVQRKSHYHGPVMQWCHICSALQLSVSRNL